MIDLLRQKNKIIVNTDIDGVLSAYVLCKYCGCEIVGFSNSADCVWWRKDRVGSIYDAVYVDMYVPRRDVLTIDQHIIAYDQSTLRKIASYGSKMNPNIDFPRVFVPNVSYYQKYPFGTIHYILCKLGKVGIDVAFDCKRGVSEKYGCSLNVADLVLRADDAMTTTLNSNYVDNARTWWWWLKGESRFSDNIIRLTNYLNDCPSEQNAVYGKKSAFERFFKYEFGCDSPDGGFTVVIDDKGYVDARVAKYMTYFFSLLGGDESVRLLNGIFSAQYETAKGKPIRIRMTSEVAAELMASGTINGEEVFSYGYVRSSNRSDNFSYTVM